MKNNLKCSINHYKSNSEEKLKTNRSTKGYFKTAYKIKFTLKLIISHALKSQNFPKHNKRKSQGSCVERRLVVNRFELGLRGVSKAIFYRLSLGSRIAKNGSATNPHAQFASSND